MIPIRKANPLCCILNATYKCNLCGSLICNECNKRDEELTDELVYGTEDINKLSHLSPNCLQSSELGFGWNELHPR